METRRDGKVLSHLAYLGLDMQGHTQLHHQRERTLEGYRPIKLPAIKIDLEQ
jgi:hypothetical protein